MRRINECRPSGRWGAALRAGVLAVAAVAGASAWAQTATPTATTAAANAASRFLAPGFEALSAGAKVLVMPVDVELFSISAGGVLEPKADWTASAHKFMQEALDKKLRGTRLELVTMSERDADAFAEQVGLHAAVAGSISLHHALGGMWSLPSKQGKLDWTFHDAMQPLQARSGARYGLFIWMRDSYASAERKAMMVGLALLGIGVGGGIQIGYASLVDLTSGQVLWFNRLGRGSGDLREAAPAAETVDVLLANFPAVR